MKRIIYKDTDGLKVIIPCNCGLSIDEIAQKDVPTGLNYKIVDTSYIPADRVLREAWTIDDSLLTDGIGA